MHSTAAHATDRFSARKKRCECLELSASGVARALTPRSSLAPAAAPFRQRSYNRSYTSEFMPSRSQRPRGSSYPLPRQPFGAPSFIDSASSGIETDPVSRLPAETPPSAPSPSSAPALPSYVDYDAPEATSADPFPTSLCYKSDPTPPTRHALASQSKYQATNTPANGSAVAGEPQSKKRARSESPVVAHLEELREKKRARSMGLL